MFKGGKTGSNRQEKSISLAASLRAKMRRHENACKLRASRLARTLARAHVSSPTSHRDSYPHGGWSQLRVAGSSESPWNRPIRACPHLARTPPSRSQWRAYPVLSPVHPLNVALRATGSGIEPAHAARAMQMTFAPSPSEVCAPAGQLRPTVATATSFQPSSAPSTW